MSTPPAPVVLTPGLAVQQAITMKRAQLKLSRRELGRRCGLSQAYVSQLEAGHLQPSLRAFAKLAVELRLSPHEIYFVIAAEARAKESVE